MIPSVLATQFREGLTDYVDTTFPISTALFEGCVRRFLTREDAFFHEPYISVKLPFRVAARGNERFTSVHPLFAPYVHQNRAYDRLCGDDAQSTLVATGTGSGKTECFLYPILEYCYKHRNTRGIKAIIIYPMNALASDQAQRIAKLIFASDELRHNVAVGMYVGGASEHENKVMLPEQVITDHETLIQSPPDILLTNYKMLDYLLVRPKDAALWQRNTNPETLKYIVVDELHTFDGAQGTDLACLLRRLKSRLMIQHGYLCCVGTSATLGGDANAGEMLDYAYSIFGEPFEADALITEDRLNAREFLEGQTIIHYNLPDEAQASALKRLAAQENEAEYIRFAAACWFDEGVFTGDIFAGDVRVELSEALKCHTLFQSLIAAFDGKLKTPSDICARLSQVYPIFAGAHGLAALDSILALISHARTLDTLGRQSPFLQVQLQLWLRELTRVLGKVDIEQTELILEADLTRANQDSRAQYLPVVNCRECGATGWTGVINERNQVLANEMDKFYNKYFRQDKHVRMVFPRRDEDENTHFHTKMQFCPRCLCLQQEQGHSRKCISCGGDTLPAWAPPLEVAGNSSTFICPFCGGEESLIIMGLRSATALSAGVSQLYASKFNDDKKLLAFNDNVQDAAHRASFYNARTWRFCLRTAIQRFVQNGGEGLTIGEFGAAFNRYYRDALSDEEYVDLFIPHNMTDDRAYEALITQGKFPDEAGKRGLLNNLEKRIAYEIMLEYGMNSRIGRTLTKSGASMITPDASKLDTLLGRALERIHNEADLRSLTRERLTGYILACLDHMRESGAFALPVYDLYVERGANYYQLTQKMISWIPPRHTNPKFPAKQIASGVFGNFEALGENCWYVRKLRQALNLVPLQSPGAPTAVSIVIEEMEKAGALKRMRGPKGLPVFGLAPDLFIVTTRAQRASCDVCGHTVTVSNDYVSAWTGAPCLRAECAGYYAPREQGADYYAQLYNHGDLVRVHAREHTGLLDREPREQLEIAFKRKKHERMPWDPNLLSCTPTLEMGIDIGDLSTVALCSVPPAQAQYLQRIGRAGRMDGNALAICVANSQPHDLYFYQEPLDMIAGNVEPPRVFLNASAVLERQFIAFCFDNWVKSGVPESAIPAKVKQILSKVKLPNPPSDVFPFNFINFIGANLSRMLRTFVLLFSPELADETKNRLEAFVKGDKSDPVTLNGRIIGAFNELHMQRSSFQKDIKKLRIAIEELKKKPKDASFEQQMNELDVERRGLSRVVERIEEKNTFEFLSDEGLLPNYAFPEAGVILKAILTRSIKSDDGAKSTYDPKIFEYNRSASSAISEFAPDNTFYAGGRKLKIDQVDVKTADKPEAWRLCPSCNFAKLDSTINDVASCPRCSSTAWADSGQVRTMLKVRTVYSNMRYDDSLSGDEHDNREITFYTKDMLVDVDESKDVEFGYRTTSGEFPFGYEFVSKATLREINFGESDSIGTKLAVAGREEVRNGFKMCKYCGKLQPRNNKTLAHTKICRAAAQNYKDPFEEFMFLYRELKSEAIRILIPSTSLDLSTTKLESFAAAIMLGLKKRFGNVDHLRYCVMDVPVSDSGYRKRYMVIYDSVPGGTGYLKELADAPKAMIDVLELSLNAMENCACASDPMKDGCYHCLFAYRNVKKLNNISRHDAVETLRKILAGKNSLERIDGISSISVNTLFDSELEKQFIEALFQAGTGDRPVTLTKSSVNGKEGYFLQIGNCRWDIELQVAFNEAQGVQAHSKADFVFTPKHSRGKQRPIAVFADGFMYHKDKVAEDSLKRMAIGRVGTHAVWSITWNDVRERLEKNRQKQKHSEFDTWRLPTESLYTAALDKRHMSKWDFTRLSSFDLLLEYLARPDADTVFTAQAQALALSMIEPKRSISEDEFNKWSPGYEVLASLNEGKTAPVYRGVFFGTYSPANTLSIYACIPKNGIKVLRGAGEGKLDYDDDQLSAVMRLDDRAPKDGEFESAWSQFLYCSNMLQFISEHAFVTEIGCENDLYSQMNAAHAAPDAPGQPFDTAWDELIELLPDQAANAAAKRMKSLGLPAPSALGYELDGEVAAEMVWEIKRIALQLPCQEKFKQALEAEGWRVFMVDSTDAYELIKEA